VKTIEIHENKFLFHFSLSNDIEIKRLENLAEKRLAVTKIHSPDLTGHMVK